MSLLTYNTVSLPYGLTTEFRQEVVYDDSETDRTLTRFDITCRGVISSHYLPWLAPDLTGQLTNPADIMEVVRTRLLAPRRPLKLEVAGVNLIPEAQPNLPGYVDAKNGPRPLRCVILDLGEDTFLFDYAVTAHYVDNPSVSIGREPIVRQENGNPVVSNRWTETVEVDSCNFSRRTREGRFVIRSDNYAGNVVDIYRNQFAVCSIPNGFRRETARYTVEASGLGLSYTLVDHEQFKMPPSAQAGSPGGDSFTYGASEADGDYIESTVNAGGSIRVGEARCSLKGAKTTDQSRLIALAVSTCVSIVQARGKQLQGLPIGENPSTPPVGLVDLYVLKYAQVRRRLYHNEVEAMVRVQYKPSINRFFGTAGFYGMSTFTPYSDGVRRSPPHRDRGTGNLLLRAAAYYDPTLPRAEQTQLSPQVIGAPGVGTPVGALKVQTRTGIEVGRGGVVRED